MNKTTSRNRTLRRSHGTRAHASTIRSRSTTQTTTQAQSTTSNRPASQKAQGRQGIMAWQGLWMPAMVALGCWGLAISFLFFSKESNHALFGAMAALMALMWSGMFYIRLRKQRR